MKQPKTYVVCGARNRQGEPCQRPPLKGKKRCRLHGGKSLETNANAVKHGIYRKTLSDDEQAMFDAIEIGNLDNEIRFAKIMLNRAIETNAAIRQDPNSGKNFAGFELTEITKQTGNGKNNTNFTSKRADTTHIIITLMGRIAGLEKTRAELIAAAAENVDNPMDKASEIRAALQAMIDVETKQPLYKPGGNDTVEDAE